MYVEVIYIFVIFCMALILFTGVFLLFRMIRTNLKNLFGLGMFFVIFATQFFLGFFDLIMIYAILSELALIFLLFFIKSTFHKESKLFFSIILTLIIVLKIIDTILRLLFGFKIPPTSSINPSEIPFYYFLVIIVSTQLVISFSWLTYAELSMYLRLKSHNIQPWVKKRYLILGISSTFFILNGFILPFIPIVGDFENLPYTILVAITIYVFSIGNLIGWVMPKRLKAYFDRNYKHASENDISERELLDKINHQLKGGD
jgi:hypothetical protein